MPNDDPWSQDLSKFVTHYKTLDPNRIPKFNVLDLNAIQPLLNLNGAVEIAFYPMMHPTPAQGGLMVAIAFDAAGNRLETATLKYGVALHNCPPDCYSRYDPLRFIVPSTE